MAREYEYKVIDTCDTGVPLRGKGSYTQKLTRGLNGLGKQGWLLTGMSDGTMLIFAREKVKG